MIERYRFEPIKEIWSELCQLPRTKVRGLQAEPRASALGNASKSRSLVWQVSKTW